MNIDKKSLSERDICSKFISPALIDNKWDSATQIREEVSFTDGQIIVKGQKYSRGKRKRADYILFHKPNIPIAIIEVKDNNHSIGDGMQQAINYGRILDVPFVYSTNGDAFLEHDFTKLSGQIETEIRLDNFPTPEVLWQRYWSSKEIEDSVLPMVTQDYHYEMGGKVPRYYQQIAINRSIEAIGKGQNRILLVMATGTGKT